MVHLKTIDRNNAPEYLHHAKIEDLKELSVIEAKIIRNAETGKELREKRDKIRRRLIKRNTRAKRVAG